MGIRTKADAGLTKSSKGRKGLKELIHENDLYSDVIAQISQRLALKEAVNSAHSQIEEKKSQKREKFSESASEITSLSKAERLIDAFQTVKVGPRNKVDPDAESSYKNDLVEQKRSIQEQLLKYRKQQDDTRSQRSQ